MKVLYDHQIFSFQTHGGISRYFCELISHLSNYSIEPDLALQFSNNLYLKKKKITNSIPFFPSLNLRIRNQFILKQNRKASGRKISEQRYDVFHPTYYSPYFLDEGLLKNKPFVLTVHDMTQERFMPNDQTINEKRQLIIRADRIIAISENTKHDILYYNADVDPDKIEVIYHGNNVTESLIAERKMHIDIPQKDYILYVGERFEYKNFKTFIRAFALLSVKYNDIILVCTGRPFNSSERALFEELKIAENVFSITAKDAEMAYLYKHALFFVFPSLYEGFGMPILEAFSLGCPIALSNTSCFPEIAGDAGVYFDPYQVESILVSMEDLLIHSEKRQRLIEKGHEREKLFSWEKTASQTAALYQSI